MRIKSRRLLSTLLAVMVAFGLFAAMPLTASAETGAQLKTTIESFAHGGTGTLTVEEVFTNPITGRTFVHVVGAVTGATNTLSLNINSDVTVIWKAGYSGSIDGNPLISLAGNGTFEVAVGGSVNQNGSGAASAIRCTGANAVVKVSDGTVNSENWLSLYMAGVGVTVDVSGGTVGGSGPKSCPIWCASEKSTVNISGGTVSSTGESYTIYVRKNSVINISGGIVSSRDFLAVNIGEENSTVNVSGGTVSSRSTTIVSEGANSAVNVSGGTVCSLAPYVNRYAIEIRDASSAVTVSGGFVFAAGATKTGGTGDGTVIKAAGASPAISGTGVVCGWKTPGETPVYADGSSNALVVNPGATATWGKSGSQYGINYANGSNTGFFPISGVTVEAAIDKYAVTFESNGGSEIDQQFVDSGNKAIKPADPTREGYTFDGWYEDPALTTAYDFDSYVTASFKLHAKWTASAVPVSITGPTTMTLTAGYAATSTGAYTVSGTFAPMVAKTSGNAAITWNNSTKKLDIAAGLAAGTYPVVLTATSGTQTAALTFTLTVMANSGTPFPFTDVLPTHWFYSDVKTAWEQGLINGKTATLYAPNDNLTYAEAVKLAACMHQLYTTGSVTLANGSPNWYDSYVTYAKHNGIINKDYDWNAQATRAGYMEIFANAIALDPINTIADGSIPDVPMTHPQAAAIYKLYRAGIVQGVDAAHNCNPGSNIKRSEVAAILTRMMNPGARISFSM